MAGGSLTLTFDTYAQAPDAIQRVLCWAGTANAPFIRTNSGTSVISLVVPEERFGVGALVLKRAGTNLVNGYVAGTNISFHVGNGGAMGQPVPACPASTNQPTVTTFVTGVGGNPLATTLTYANVAAAGTVNIFWGDGTSTLGAAESGSSNHTYALSGPYVITIQDASVTTDQGSLAVHVP